MAAKFVVFVAFLALANARMVRRETSPLDEIQRHAADFQKTFTEQFNALVNSKSTQEVTKSLKEGSDSVLVQLSSFSTALQGAVNDASGKAKVALEQTKQRIDQTVAELRRQHPDVEQQASHLRDKLQQAIQSTVQESQNLAKEVQANAEATNQKLAPQIKQAYDDFVRQAEAVQKRVQEAVNKQ
ncbi:apolipophorin-3-like [Cydia pomonella]|uniref:apolipophorin-3-like n=1 Tax=Cydia pomonella TaxID=82600 RepID=UPI002ADE11B0|nr:apolipophorin-3-like [Cydia pomonella]